MDLHLRNSRMEVVDLESLGYHFVVAKRLIIGSSASWNLEYACRSSCLEVGVLAAGMTRTRWGEAYQRLHSIDCNMLVYITTG